MFTTEKCNNLTHELIEALQRLLSHTGIYARDATREITESD